MTAIDRVLLIEAAAKAISIYQGSYLYMPDTQQPIRPTTEQTRLAEAAAPAIVAAALKPLRDLHQPHPYADAQLRSVSPSLPEFVCAHCATPSGGAVAFPCPTVRLLDQIEADMKGSE